MNKVKRDRKGEVDLNTDLTRGSIRKSLILFAIPLLFSQLFQILYNTADTVIIGHYLGDHALAAVGSVSPLFELIVGFSNGFGLGFSIIAAQNFGARDLKAFRKTGGLSVLLCLTIGVIISAAVGIFMPQILQILKTRPELFEMAYSYIIVIACGLIITIFYNLLSGLMRAAGDSTTPLIILILSSIINILLDLWFIGGLNLSVASTAWATLIAQFCSLFLCLIWVSHRHKELLPTWSDIRWNAVQARNLLKMGFSMALMSSIVSIGTLILQTSINLMSVQTITGHTAARKLFIILDLPLASMTNALSAYVAQNHGSGQILRLEKGIAFGNRVSLYSSILAEVLVLFWARWMIATISGSNDPEVLNLGSLYLWTNVPFFVFLGVLCNLRTSLQSMSITSIPVLSSVIELIGKLVFTWFIIPNTGYYGVCFSEPVVWILMTVFLGVFYLKAPDFKKEKVKPHIFF